MDLIMAWDAINVHILHALMHYRSMPSHLALNVSLECLCWTQVLRQDGNFAVIIVMLLWNCRRTPEVSIYTIFVAVIYLSLSHVYSSSYNCILLSTRNVSLVSILEGGHLNKQKSQWWTTNAKHAMPVYYKSISCKRTIQLLPVAQCIQLVYYVMNYWTRSQSWSMSLVEWEQIIIVIVTITAIIAAVIITIAIVINIITISKCHLRILSVFKWFWFSIMGSNVFLVGRTSHTYMIIDGAEHGTQCIHEEEEVSDAVVVVEEDQGVRCIP